MNQTTSKRRDLTEIQKEMLRQMLEWDNEYSYPYSEFTEITLDGGIVQKKTLQKEMRGLVSRGFVKISRGGIDDDGQLYGGTGFYLDSERMEDIKFELLTTNK